MLVMATSCVATEVLFIMQARYVIPTPGLAAELESAVVLGLPA